MRRNSTSSMGAFHPVIFFTLIYGISLVLAIFVCRIVYDSMHADDAVLQQSISGSTAATAFK